MGSKIRFSPEQDKFIIDNLALLGCRKIGEKLGLSKSPVQKRAKHLGLQNILLENSLRSRTQKGNKRTLGLKMSDATREKVKGNFFKKGQKPHNTQEVGSKRIKVGYSQIKTENGFEFEQRLIWEKHFGEIPDNHLIIFRDGDKTNLEPENLECISKDEQLIRNTVTGDYPREIQQLEYAAIKLQRKIKEINGKK